MAGRLGVIAQAAVGAPHRPGRRERAVRVAMIAFGGAALAVGLVVQRGRGFGPAQLQVSLLGLLLLVAGSLRRPAQLLESTFVAAEGQRTGSSIVTASTRGILGAIVVFAFIFRVWMAATYWPSSQMVMGMALWDAEMARNLLQGRGWVLNQEFVKKVDRAVVARNAMVDPEDLLPADDSRAGALATFPNYAHTPGYSMWLAASFVLGGANRFVYSQWMQAALDSLGCLLVFGIARRLWSTNAGLIAATAYALSTAHVYVAIQTLAAATDGFWVLLIGYGIVRLWTDRAAGRSAMAGILIVAAASFLGTMMNSTVFVLPIVSAAWAIVVAVLWRPAAKAALFLGIAQALVVLLVIPWGLRNRQVYGHFTLVRGTFWQLAWETLGQLPNPWGLALGKDDLPYFQWVDPQCGEPCTGDRREEITRDYLVRNVLTSPALPGHLARLVALRLPGLVYVSRMPIDKPYPMTSTATRAVGAALNILNVFALLLFPASLLGLLLVTLRGAPAATAAWLALAPTIFVIAFSLAFFVEHRKTTPAYGYLIALSGIAGAALIEGRAKSY